MKTKLIFVFAFLLALHFASAQFSGTASYVNYQSYPSFTNYYSGSVGSGLGTGLQTYWPILANPQECQARQDILLQVAPAGCQPTVVRSDLLAEQNVPVFCQLDALKVNPLLDIKQISSISFAGNYPTDKVVGVGFHPALAALRTQDSLLGSPIVNNVGYVVVVLRKQANESQQAEFINFTLGARVQYYAGNAIGLGASELLLQPISDSEWISKRNRQSFYHGQFFMRLEDADPTFARVSIYSGEARIATIRIDRGASQEIYLPGTYCQGRLRVYYDGIISADSFAELKVDDDSVKVYTGSSFLNGKCRVSRVSGDSYNGTVDFTCSGQSFSLKLAGRALSVNDVVVKSSESGNSNAQRWIITSVDSVKRNYTIVPGGSSNVNPIIVGFEDVVTVDTTSILQEKYYGGYIDDYFREAIDRYSNVADSYPTEIRPGANELGFYGEESLYRAVDLALDLGKEQTAAKLIQISLDKYPNSVKKGNYLSRLNSFYQRDSSLAGVSVLTDDGYHSVRLDSVSKSSVKSSADLFWDELSVGKVSQGETRKVPGGNITIDRIESERVYGYAVCDNQNSNNGASAKQPFNLNVARRLPNGQLDTQGTFATICGHSLKLDSTDVAKIARIRLNPATTAATTTMTNFSVGIGIEQRAIKLAPDKALEQIAKLNKTIEQWQSIVDGLGKVVSGLKAACFATAGVLTVKSFFTGLDGESLARQQIMRGTGGWGDKCRDMVANHQYATMTECYNAHSGEIEKDVDAYAKGIANTNAQLRTIEQANKIKGSGAFSGDIVDQDKATEALRQALIDKYSGQSVVVNGESKTVSSLLDGTDAKDLNYGDLREMYLNLETRQAGGLSDSGKQSVDNSLNSIGQGIQQRKESKNSIQGISEKFQGNIGKVFSATDRYAINGEYYGGKITDDVVNTIGGGIGEDKDKPGQLVHYGSKNYLVVLEKGTNGYSATHAYALDSNGKAIEKVTDLDGKSFGTFVQATDVSYYNTIKNPEIQYYETGVYKGMPAVVPFKSGVGSGWYAATRQTLPVAGGLKSYEANGRPVNFWVCNVGANGRVEFFSGTGDDVCRQFNYYSGESSGTYPGLDQAKTRQLVADAVHALDDASAGYGKRSVGINGIVTNVGGQAISIPGSECQEFMSADDCKLLFNVCDPVICPPSRCDFGGAYPVADVVQTGIVGSTLLCLPNVREGIAIPVCLTGIQAGLDSWLSILKSHRDCLQESVDTGQYTGTCDLITSIYLCEFFWRQAAPLANIAIPATVDFLYTGGQRVRGGGEYLTVQSAWDNAQKSVEFFTQSYAANALAAYNVRSIEDVGSPFCKAFLSVKGPSALEGLIEPESPPQFTGWFSEIPYSDATVPATSQYKLFYHIYSGNDQGTAYSVYLKDPPTSSYYQGAPYITVATGFIPRGEYKTETKDFTAPTGYKQMCIRYNGKDECGFKQVSTSFAVNYVRDEFVSNEIKRNDITTESQCVSGGTNPSALLNPNLQEAAQEAINPAIYNRGIVRVCSTQNPGAGTDPTRYIQVGYCDTSKIGCWLDQNSVDSAITANNLGVKNETLTELSKRQQEQLKQQNPELFVDDSAAQIAIGQLESEFSSRFNPTVGTRTSLVENAGNLSASAGEFLMKIQKVSNNLVFNQHKARLAVLWARVYDLASRESRNQLQPAQDNTQSEQSSSGQSIETQQLPSVSYPYFQLTQTYNPATQVDIVKVSGKNADGLIVEPVNVYFSGNKIYFVTEEGPDEIIGTVQSGKIGFISSGRTTLDNAGKSDVYQTLEGSTISGIGFSIKYPIYYFQRAYSSQDATPNYVLIKHDSSYIETTNIYVAQGNLVCSVGQDNYGIGSISNNKVKLDLIASVAVKNNCESGSLILDKIESLSIPEGTVVISSGQNLGN